MRLCVGHNDAATVQGEFREAIELHTRTSGTYAIRRRRLASSSRNAELGSVVKFVQRMTVYSPPHSTITPPSCDV